MEDPKLKCGCIARSNYDDDASDCKYKAKISKGCNRMDYNPNAKRIQIASEHRIEMEMER